MPIPAPVAALAVPLREYSEFSVRYFALQRLLLVCPVMARTSTTAMPHHRDSEYDRYGHYLPAFNLMNHSRKFPVASPSPLSLLSKQVLNTSFGLSSFRGCPTCGMGRERTLLVLVCGLDILYVARYPLSISRNQTVGQGVGVDVEGSGEN